MKFRLYGDTAKQVKENQTFQVVRIFDIEGRTVAELVECP